MWKKSKKVLYIQENGCYYKQADAWEMKVLNAEQKNKKVVDKHETLWYNIKAVAWNGNNKKRTLITEQ